MDSQERQRDVGAGLVIKSYEKGKLVSVQLTEWEQHDLALKNNKMLREQDEEEAESNASSSRDTKEVQLSQEQEGLPKET